MRVAVVLVTICVCLFYVRLLFACMQRWEGTLISFKAIEEKTV